MARRVDQLVAGFAGGDAISQEARMLQSMLRQAGFESDIFAPVENLAPAMQEQCRTLSDYKAEKDAVCLFHFSSHSPATAVFEQTVARRIVRYHNITPAHFFRGFDDRLAAELSVCRNELLQVCAKAGEVWCDSDFNASELSALEDIPVRTVPLFFELTKTDGADPVMMQALSGMKNFFFVGRMAPNKAVEDLILAYANYVQHYDLDTRLVLAGSGATCPRYYSMLRWLAARLNLPNVLFLDYVTDAQLKACYQSAQAYICTSRHEGYCLPLVEAMMYDIPVFARHSGGMPQTVGNSAVLFDEENPRQLAALINFVLSNPDQVLSSQREHIKSLKKDRTPELLQLLTQLL